MSNILEEEDWIMSYYLGLDVGSASVGWAVCNKNYELCKFKGKDMWGIRLFENAQTAATRREKRANRRRLQRRKQRIDLLQEIFAEEMLKVDSTFFIRLNESRLYLEDKSEKFLYPLFKEKEYTDLDYYKEYPTIFHLRKELIENDTFHDIRLVYLALHHIIKYRGHFLIQGDLDSAKDFFNTFNTALEALCDELEVDITISEKNKAEFQTMLRNKNLSKSEKAKKLFLLFDINNNVENKNSLKEKKGIVEQLCKFIVGNKGDLTKLFLMNKENFEISSFSFTEKKYDESIRENLDNELQEKAYLIDLIKSLHDWNILADILHDEKFISFAKVKQYEKHGENLKQLRKIILKYCDKKIYNDFFNNAAEEKGNYSSFVGNLKKNGKKYNVKRCSGEDFYKELKGILTEIKPDEADKEILSYFTKGCETRNLLPLQRSKENGVIPYQVNEVELNSILDNAIKYLDFLNKKDESGVSDKDKIKSLFTFRIPYYVGPLSDKHKDEGANVWMIRRKNQTGRIYPWNFETMVDLEKSNQRFIERMTNKCTYIMGEDVLAKNSLLYTKYMVLDELNNLKVKGNKISESLKKSIYNDLFKQSAKVTGKKLLEYLRKDLPELSKEDLSGFDIDFKSSLNSYLDFKKKVFGERIEDKKVQSMIENIIRWITIYGDDKKMLKNVVSKEYSKDITAEELKNICKLSYSGWGNFSKKFLKGIIGADEETGESFNIIEALWETNNNLMQILSQRFTFREEIDTVNNEKVGKIKKISYENVVENMYASPSVKRAIWQSIQIAEEIKKVMGKEPEKIFIEMARGENEKKKKVRNISRKEWLKSIYKDCEKDIRERFLEEIEAKNERDFNSRKLFLYYTQMGRCMYTGELIDFDSLIHKNSRWDKDHIYPKSKIKDDSIDNFVLVKKRENNEKSNEVLDAEIQTKMQPFWKILLEKGFISKKKYDRLMKKGDFTEEELSGFISRQLVETRQSTKILSDIFKLIYEKSELVYVKANLVSDFRHDTIKMLKSRRLNDYHHAKDAYLNIVVGNVYNAKFTSNPVKWLKENKDKNYSLNKIFDYDVFRGKSKVWNADKTEGSIKTVRRVMESDKILYTEHSYCAKGELFDASIKRKGENSNIPLKSNLDTSKYGGYNSPTSSYFALIEFDEEKGEKVNKKRNIIAVPLYVANMLEHNPDAFLDYCMKIKKFKNVKILYPKIKKNALITVDSFPMRIRGENEKDVLLKNNLQLRLDNRNAETIRLIERFLNKEADYEPNAEIDKIDHKKLNSLYDVLTDKLKTVYVKRPANQYKILELKREKFVNSNNLYGKMKLLNNIFTLLRCDATNTTDLSFIGAGKNVGSIKINKNTMCKSKLFLVNQSITGLFENRVKL